ncbi:MAG: alpha-L-rhamnosidase [Bacteroidales bacterium]|nr:alpha-L-rhamnosidase [Bacteroidales bacterium]
MKSRILLTVLTAFLAVACSEYPSGLRTDLMLDTSQPDGALIRSSKPSFSWIVPGTESLQTSYQIKLTNNRKVIWDSGWVESGQSVSVPYDGKPLQGGTTYDWKVRVKTSESNRSNWSARKRFTTANDLQEYETAWYPLVQERQKAVSLKPLIDFGRDAFGWLELTLRTSEDGVATVHVGERIDNGKVWRLPAGSNSSVRYAKIDVPVSKGIHVYPVYFEPDRRNTGPSAVKLPEEVGVVMPFRYCEVSGAEVVDARRIAVSYPFNAKAASFDCSNDTLNRIWDLCHYSVKATSFAGIYVDGDRERIPYEYDALIAQLCHYAADSEYSLARRTMEFLLNQPTWPTEWILYEVLLAWNDYMFTADPRAIAAHWDILKAHGLEDLLQENGFVSTTKGQSDAFLKSINRSEAIRDIVDWPHTGILGLQAGQGGEDDGYVYTDYNTVVNALYYKVLCTLGKMAAVLGKDAEAGAIEAKAASFRKAFNATFFDSTRGVYVDGIGTDHSSLHGNMMPVYCGLVDEGQMPSVAGFIQSRGLRCSIFGAQVLMEAVYDAGLDDYGLSLLSSGDLRSWYNTIRTGSTITIEAWDDSFKPNQDWNHIAGAAPGNIIPFRVMGVTPVEPGFAKVRIEPHIASLTYAKMKLPTIRGEITMDIETAGGGKSMIVSIPANMEAEICLPGGEVHQIGPGKHQFSF